MDNKKKGIGLFIAAILAISVFAVMCTPASAVGAKAMISLKDTSGADLGVQVSDLEGRGIEIIEVGENFVTASVTKERFEQLTEEGYIVAWLKEGQPQAYGAIGGQVATSQGFPPIGWAEVVYSGDGHWEQREVAGSWKDPLNAAGYYAIADSDANSAWVYDVGLRTPSIDLSGCTTVTLDCDLAFEDFVGCDDAYIRTWSDGTMEEVLAHWSTDMNQFHFTKTFDPSGYTNPSGVQIEFYYTTNGGTWCWFFSVDNVKVTCDGIVVLEEDFDFGEPKPTAVPALTPIGLIALIGLLSVIAAVSIRTGIRKKRR